MVKEQISITIEKELLKKLNAYCKKNSMVRSGVIERSVLETIIKK